MGIRASLSSAATAHDRQLSRVQWDFLPAALEVQETPPSPAGCWLIWILTLLFTIALLWATLGEIDIVVSAPGRIIPSGQVKVVQAPETGAVVAIHVSEGERVEAGQALIRLDSTYADADSLRIRGQLADVRLRASWRAALERWLAQGRGEVVPIRIPAAASPADRARAKALYMQQRAELDARLDALEKERDAALAGRAVNHAEEDKVQATLAILQERVAAHKSLLEKQYGARARYLEMLQAETELQNSIPVLAAQARQLEENAAALNARIQAALGEQRSTNLMELARLEAEERVLQQELRKAGQRQKQQVISAPVTGTVQQLATHTVGGVVTPAQELMKIVPEGVAIEVEAMLQNRDVGFVHEGQFAEVKIDTFNFTRYGIIDAKVADISDDAMQDERLGWVFKMRLLLEQDRIAIEEKMVRLSPGMSVTAEVRTGKRRLIEFFLSPLLRYKNESIRER